MKIELHEIKVRDLVKGYKDSGDEGVVAYDGNLDVRPPYQREFIYKEKQRNAVIDTIMKGFPLNVMYWVSCGDGKYEVMDGQQRTISIAQYFDNEFSFNMRYFHNLEDDEQEKFLDYTLMVYFCEGSDSEKLDWFRTINIAGEQLTNQELRNAVYHGPFVQDAKRWFSKVGAPAAKIGGDYLMGARERQDYLETAIKWISDGAIEEYMASHAKDPNANVLWNHFQSIIGWIEATFVHTKDRLKILKGVDWGTLYRKYGSKVLDTKALEKRIATLLMDDDVTKKSGIVPYVLGEGERCLSIRAFTEAQKLAAYTRQGGVCKMCGKKFNIDEMNADHIKPWSKGGHTTPDNCQMLCSTCNFTKSDK